MLHTTTYCTVLPRDIATVSRPSLGSIPLQAKTTRDHSRRSVDIRLQEKALVLTHYFCSSLRDFLPLLIRMKAHMAIAPFQTISSLLAQTGTDQRLRQVADEVQHPLGIQLVALWHPSQAIRSPCTAADAAGVSKTSGGHGGSDGSGFTETLRAPRRRLGRNDLGRACHRTSPTFSGDLDIGSGRIEGIWKLKRSGAVTRVGRHRTRQIWIRAAA